MSIVEVARVRVTAKKQTGVGTDSVIDQGLLWINEIRFV